VVTGHPPDRARLVLDTRASAAEPPCNASVRHGDRQRRNAWVMKTWATLAAAAALTIGAGAHATEPLKLDDTALDSVTAGSYFAVEASTFGAQALFLGSNLALGGGSTTEQAYAFGERKVTSSGETLKLHGWATGQSAAAGPGLAQASGGAEVFLLVFTNGIVNGNSL
jgi:hypothetical protein